MLTSTTAHREENGTKNLNSYSDEDYIALCDLMSRVLKYDEKTIEAFVETLGRINAEIVIERRLPDDCIEVVAEIEKIISWHRSDGTTEQSPDVIVYNYNLLSSYRATLGELHAWYSNLADISNISRRNWRAGIYTSLRMFGGDMETNIKRRTTVRDAEEQAEMLNIAQIKKQAYACYVDSRLSNLRADSKTILDAMKERLIEMRYERRSVGDDNGQKFN